MLRLISGIVIFLVILSTSIFSIFDLSSRCYNIIEIAEETKELVEEGNMELAAVKQSKLESYWEDQENIMRLYIRREILDDIDSEMGSLSELIKLGDKCESGESLDSIVEYCYQLIEDEKPLLYNIL
ncbi:MAG: DUF4363 family protein [Oscillospiraceae bacterium]|nr:DUF4363 family protein [Oscillospiraceae bacterium]